LDDLTAARTLLLFNETHDSGGAKSLHWTLDGEGSDLAQKVWRTNMLEVEDFRAAA
jgi:hypothetical protein